MLLFRIIRDLALTIERERAAREASPTPAVIDSQAIKALAARAGGHTDRRLLMMNLTTADIADSIGAQTILDAIR